MVRRLLLWVVGFVAASAVALVLAVLLWPHPVGVAAVAATAPEVVSPDMLTVFSAEDQLTLLTSRLLQRQATDFDQSRGVEMLVRDTVLSIRLGLFTTVEQRAAYLALHSYYGFKDADLGTLTMRCFGRPPDSLNLAEAAELAVRMRSPAFFMIREGLSRLQEGRDRLLVDLRKQRLMSEAHLKQALEAPLGDCL